AAPEPPSLPTQLTPFVGRSQELETLGQAFAESRSPSSVVVLVEGESGVGKSALVRRFADGLAQRTPGLLIFAGRCYERESVPYKAFDSIVDGLSRHLIRIDPALAGHLLPDDATLLARVFPVLRRVPAMRQVMEPQRHLPDPQELRGRAFAALRRLLRGIAGRWPVLLVIDDLQWADADSLALLADVMHPPQAPATLLIATVRTDTETTASDLPALGPLEQALGGVRRVA